MKVLFWDIDGTLLQAGHAGRYAFDQAVREIYGRTIDYRLIQTSGMTDDYIAKQIIELIKGAIAEPSAIAALTARYEELLPHYLTEKPGYILGGALEILTELHEHEDYVQLILTGNSRHGAEEKLAHYGLYDFFDFDHSAFGDGCFDRNEISAKAKQIADEVYPNVSANDIYVIGDTPNDVRCGKSIGVRTIAVASGRYSYEELASCSPWQTMERLGSPKDFLLILEK
ncbi:MAG: HAD family hydrolase [Selenomonadales bacterium]|nr:HAD family hydrolase [Selenomonadales bacterium]